MSELQWQIIGLLGFALMIAGIIVVMKGLAWISDRMTARAYAPLAQAVGGQVDLKGPWIVLTHRGWRLRGAFSEQTNVGTGESARTIKTFWIQVQDVRGQSNWVVRYCLTGLFGQGPLQLALETNDLALASRLEGRGIYAAVASVTMPSTYYAPVEYDPWARTLLLVDDVSQGGLPKPETLLLYAELAVRLVELNAEVNPPAGSSI
jgi:hypothetical protein